MPRSCKAIASSFVVVTNVAAGLFSHGAKHVGHSNRSFHSTHSSALVSSLKSRPFSKTTHKNTLRKRCAGSSEMQTIVLSSTLPMQSEIYLLARQIRINDSRPEQPAVLEAAPINLLASKLAMKLHEPLVLVFCPLDLEGEQTRQLNHGRLQFTSLRRKRSQE